MSAEEVFAQWSADFRARSPWEDDWFRLAISVGKRVVHNSQAATGRVVLDRLNDLDWVVSDLRIALRGQDAKVGLHPCSELPLDQGEAATSPWLHLKPEVALVQGSHSDHFRKVDGLLLGQVAERYMRSPWLASDVLEWIMVDAFVYRDVVSFGENLKQNVKGLKEAVQVSGLRASPRRIARRAVGVFGELSAFVGGPIVAAALAPIYISGPIAPWILPVAIACVVIYVNVAMLRALRRGTSKKLISKCLGKWSAMSAAYRFLEPRVVSIARVQKALANAATRDVSWDGHVAALLDYANKRGVQTWNCDGTRHSIPIT
jgi:hypothetical protein